MSLNSHSTPPNLRRILNRVALLISTPEAAKWEGVSDDSISALLIDCENASKTDIEIANSLFSRLANKLEELESRLQYKHGTEFKRTKEPWRRIAICELPWNAPLADTQAIPTEKLEREVKLQLQKWLSVDQETISRRIQSKSLLTLQEIQSATNAEKKDIRNAVRAGRMFFVIGPDSEKYYPSFFGDTNSYFKRCIEKVCKELADVPVEVKYGFFTTPSHWLGDLSPIAALHAGKLKEVMDIARDIF